MKIATKVIRDGKLIITFADGETHTIRPDDFNEEIQAHAQLHGYKQKLGDSWANHGESLKDAKAEFMAVLESLKAGDWNRKGGGDGGMVPEALAAVTGESLEDCIAKWQDADDDKKAKIRKHPQVAAKLAAMKAEKAARKAANADAPSLDDIL